MSISLKTHKILWARSGGKCAICKNTLVIDPTNLNDDRVSVTTFGTAMCHNTRNSPSASMRGEEQNPLRTHFFERCTISCREGDLEIRDNDPRCIVKTKRSERCDT